MALLRPNKEDTQKLHAEVNQIVNQRLALTTLGIMVFGTAIAWLIPRDSEVAQNSIGAFRYIASILLTVVLFALFLLTHHLTRMLRILTTYLDVSKGSNWEKDWVAYRRAFRYFGYSKPQAIIFILLGIASTGFPFLLWATYGLNLDPRPGAILCIIPGILYVVFVWAMGMSIWFTKEDDYRRQWYSLIDHDKSEADESKNHL